MLAEARPDYPQKPLRPDEVLAVKAETFPAEVFIAVNGLIAERLCGQYAKLTLKALRKRMTELGFDKQEIEEKGWDRVGAVYEQAGWEVGFHSPGYDDREFDPYYSFHTKGPRCW